MRRGRAAAAVLACLLAGCSDASLELQPAVLSGCTPVKAEVIHVRWDARDAATERVRIEVTRPGGGSRPWTSGPAQGAKDTGAWGSDGLTFVLLAEDGRELARRTLETSPCPADEGPAARK